MWTLRWLALLLVLGVGNANADVGSHPPGLVAAFAVRKTENRNRVEYGVRASATCDFEGRAPVVPYWRMLERGASVFERLGRFERRAYGVDSQVVAADHVMVRLRPMRDRTVEVRLLTEEQACRAVATTRIGGRIARIRDVLVVQSGPLSVHHIELEGVTLDDGTRVHELLRD